MCTCLVRQFVKSMPRCKSTFKDPCYLQLSKFQGLPCLFTSECHPCLFTSECHPCLFTAEGHPCLFTSEGLPSLFTAEGLPCLFTAECHPCLFTAECLPCLFTSEGRTLIKDLSVNIFVIYLYLCFHVNGLFHFRNTNAVQTRTTIFGIGPGCKITRVYLTSELTKTPTFSESSISSCLIPGDIRI